MPNCDFYALGEDHRTVLEFLLTQCDCTIYELCSEPGREVAQFQDLSDFQKIFGFSEWSVIPRTMHLQIHAKEGGGRVHQKRINLVNANSPDVAFRFKTEGWGLIQLYLLAPRKGSLSPSHTNHNSETRATTWRHTIDDMGDPNEWDWRAVTAFSRRLNNFIRKTSVAKEGSRLVLPAAQQARSQGVGFSLN